MKNEQAHLEINLKAAEFQLCTLQCLGDCFMIMTCKINQSVQKSLQKCLDLRHIEDGPYRYQPDQWITKQFWTVYCHLSVRTWFGFILALASIRTKSSETFMSFRFKKKKCYIVQRNAFLQTNQHVSIHWRTVLLSRDILVGAGVKVRLHLTVYQTEEIRN